MAVPRVRVVVVAGPLPDSIGVSIILPVLNEAELLDHSLANLFACRWVQDQCEVIVCDGGSTDGSVEIAGRYPCRIVQSEAGRALQMNAASAEAAGVMLLFLHVDSTLPAAFDTGIDTDAAWGFFRLRLDGGAIVYRLIETLINLRSRISRVAGGDQGLYFNRQFFDRIQGYPQIPLMEDIAISKTARRLAKPVIIEQALTSSSRRWRDKGVIKTVVLMWLLRLAYWLGVDPQRLHKIYYPQRG